MKRIFKYPLNLDDHIEVELPAGAKILSFQEQHGQPVVWALVDPASPFERRRFRCAGTGHPLEDAEASDYIGSAQFAGGRLVFHLFEER